MESDLPVPIDDSLPFVSGDSPVVRERQQEIEEEEEEIPRRQYHQQEQQYYYVPPPQFEPPPQKKSGDIFAELDRIHWIIFLATVLLAFFMGKSISTPIIIKSV